MEISELTRSLDGRVYVVTGANSGIGFEACKNFASRGATVAMVCRDAEKGSLAKQKLMQDFPDAQIKLFIADFSSLDQVSKLAKSLLQAYSSIDVLCNNAGGANASRQVTAEGFELTFVSNHLSNFLLTLLLLPALGVSPNGTASRVVFTSSLGHKNSPLDFEDLGLEEGYSTLKAYGRSKLMNLLTARALHQRYKDRQIEFSSFHPGAVRTAIWAKGGLLARLIGLVMYPFMWTVEKGADTFIWLASSDDADAVNPKGEYFFDRKRVSIAEFATDSAADRLFEVSEKLVKPWY